MESFSSRLIRAREQRNITLQELSLSTKIHMRFLIAIEQGRFDELPGGIISKRFLQAYARHVGIDEDEAIAEYRAIVQAHELNKSSPPAARAVRKPKTDVTKILRPQWALAAACLVLSFAVADLAHYQVERQQHDEAVVVPSPKQVVHPASVPGAGESRAHKVQSQRIVSPSATVNDLEDAGNPASEPKDHPDETSANVLVSSLPPAPDVFSVHIKAREDAWISIVVDGKRILQTMLEAPAETSVAAHQQVIIRAGNIGALDFSFNGQQLAAQGDYDEARTLSFDPTGLQEPVLKAATAVLLSPPSQ